jgi:2-dehydropantoate 2-reductase
VSSRFLVVGAGGIGGVVASHLTAHGHDVTALTNNPTIAAAIADHGYRLRGDAVPAERVPGRAAASVADLAGYFDYVLLATQPPQVEAAARQVAHLVADHGHVVCFQNGLCEERVAEVFGADRVIGAIVAWGASMVEPGLYDRTSAGGFQLGHLDGRASDALAHLARALECIGETTLTKNLRGARWSKLAINAAISSLGTVGGDRLGVLMRKRHVRRLALEIMTETVHVAQALGVPLEKVSGTLDLEWIALTPEDRAQTYGSPSLFAKHALLLAVGARYRRLRSSMLAAIERGRVPAVEFLNGEVVRRGAEVGVPTPVNAAIRDFVLAIASGQRASSRASLIELFESTRRV